MFRLFRRWFSSPPPAEVASDAASNSDAAMELAGAHWGERAREQQLAVLPGSWAEIPVVIREYINPRVSGTGDQGWLEAVARDYFKQPVKVALSLGCGGGGLERHGLQLNIATRFEAYDVSAGAIELAREEAGITGQQDAIDYQVAISTRSSCLPDAMARYLRPSRYIILRLLSTTWPRCIAR